MQRHALTQIDEIIDKVESESDGSLSEDDPTQSDENQAMCLVINLLKTYKTCPMDKNIICCFADAFLYENPYSTVIFMDMSLRL